MTKERKTKVYKFIAGKLAAMQNCEKAGNAEWYERHKDALLQVMEFAPSGGGFDSGTRLLNLDYESLPWNKLQFYTSFHHMTEHGYYDGWTDHTVTVRPCLLFGFQLTVSGKNRNDIKEYIAEIFNDWLDWIVTETKEGVSVNRE